MEKKFHYMRKLLFLLPLLLLSVSDVSAQHRRLNSFSKADHLNAGSFLGSARTACAAARIGLLSNQAAKAFLDAEFKRIGADIHPATILLFTQTKFMQRLRNVEPCKSWVDRKAIEFGLPLHNLRE